MAVSLSEVEDLVLSIINASSETYGTSDDPLHPDAEIVAAVKASALNVIGAILESSSSRRRAEFLSLLTIPADGLVKGSMGAILIDAELGTKISPSKLRRYKANINLLTTISGRGYFSTEEHIIRFIGSAGQVVTIDDSSGTMQNSVPDEYFWAVVTGALALAFPKEGSNSEIALGFGGLHKSMIDAIRMGQADVIPVSPYGTKA